jgi:hypothetical protein
MKCECGETLDTGCFGQVHCPDCQPCLGCYEGEGYWDYDHDYE